MSSQPEDSTRRPSTGSASSRRSTARALRRAKASAPRRGGARRRAPPPCQQGTCGGLLASPAPRRALLQLPQDRLKQHLNLPVSPSRRSAARGRLRSRRQAAEQTVCRPWSSDWSETGHRGAYHRRGYAFCAASGVAGWQQPAGILDYPLRGSDSSASLALSRERVRLRLRAVGADRVAIALPDAPPRSLLLPFAGEALRLVNLRRETDMNPR